jgi:hypothetical protein
MNGVAYQLSKTEEDEVVKRTNEEIARDHVTSPARAKEVALRHTLAVIRERRPKPEGTMHERLVMALGKVTLSQVFSPLERELLTVILDAVEPIYRPTPPDEDDENAIRAVEIEALSQRVCEVAVQYIAACRSEAHPDEKYPAIDLWKGRLGAAVTEYTDAVREQYG